MKVAILSESPADEAAVRILIEAILGESIELETLRVRPGGWKPAIRAIPPTLKGLHYQRTADALAVVVDSDNSTVHRPEHFDADSEAGDCRFCAASQLIRDTDSTLRPMPDWPPIHTAIAVATPAVEAWYLFGINPDCTEAGWLLRQASGGTAPNEIRRWKKAVYGSDRPNSQRSLERAVESATRLAADLENFENHFPNSFGLFAEAVRSWKAVV